MKENRHRKVYLSGHPAGRSRRLRRRDLVPRDLILLSQGSSAREHFERGMGDAKSGTGLRCDDTNMTTAASLVRQGLGLGCDPDWRCPACPCAR